MNDVKFNCSLIVFYLFHPLYDLNAVCLVLSDYRTSKLSNIPNNTDNKQIPCLYRQD